MKHLILNKRCQALSYIFLHIMPYVLDSLSFNIHQFVVCSEYGIRDYHYYLHSCYTQPDATYWLQVVWELWRNVAMMTCLLVIMLFMTVCAIGIAQLASYLFLKGINYARTQFNNMPDYYQITGMLKKRASIWYK